MRADMSRVIVERPRRGGLTRRGRSLSFDDLSQHEGMRRRHRIGGNWKELNENLAPLRRYLERQVGRPWSKVYSEITAHLRADNTVQQHVRDHLRDFVAVKPLRHAGLYANRMSGLWHQPLYVDERDGILKHTAAVLHSTCSQRVVPTCSICSSCCIFSHRQSHAELHALVRILLRMDFASRRLA